MPPNRPPIKSIISWKNSLTFFQTAAKVFDDAETMAVSGLLNSSADFGKKITCNCYLQSIFQRLLCGKANLLFFLINFTNHISICSVSIEAVFDGGNIDIDCISFLDDNIRRRNAVSYNIIYTDAGIAREAIHSNGC